jgi:hypothetical protein
MLRVLLILLLQHVGLAVTSRALPCASTLQHRHLTATAAVVANQGIYI